MGNILKKGHQKDREIIQTIKKRNDELEERCSMLEKVKILEADKSPPVVPQKSNMALNKEVVLYEKPSSDLIKQVEDIEHTLNILNVHYSELRVINKTKKLCRGKMCFREHHNQPLSL